MKNNPYISLMGYNKNSPFQNEPYLDIQTPSGSIDMSNVKKGFNLWGEDELGNIQKMIGGRKNPYQFKGQVVRETPVKGNPYKKGGMTPQELFSFLDLFGEEEEQSKNIPTAPSTEDINSSQKQDDLDDREKLLDDRKTQLDEKEQYDFSMQIATANLGKSSNTSIGPKLGINPYLTATEKDIFGEFPVTNLGIMGDAKHQERDSDHNTGDAQDFGVSSIELGNQITAKLQKEAGNRKIKYIIFNNKIWNPSVSNEWRPFTGEDDHKTHVHVSYER